jgi:hypothetical protein
MRAASGTAFDRVVDALESAGSRITGPHDRRMATCPAHHDGNASLSVKRDTDRVLLKCHAGCETAEVVAALRLTMSDLFDEPHEPRRMGAYTRQPNKRVVDEYIYCDESGVELFRKTRFEPKGFRQKRPDGRGGWIPNLEDTRKVLYRLPEVLAAVAGGRPVYVVEGEKDADRLASLGLAATCNFDGAGKWRSEYGDALSGAAVVVIADRDVPGLKHARMVVADLEGKATSVRVVQSVTTGKGHDVSDHLDAGHSLDELTPVDLTEADDRQQQADDPVADPSDSATDGGSGSTVTRIITFARERWEFGNDGGGDLFAVTKIGPRLVERIGEGSSFRRTLTGELYEATGRTFRGESYSIALDVLRHEAAKAEPTPLHLRVARWRDGVVVDLADRDGRIVEVGPTGWRIVPAGPEHPLFRRTRQSRPLPQPAIGGDLGELAELLGFGPQSDEFRLVTGWLVSAVLLPDVERPAPWWTGPEGAGKSTRSALLVSVIDPRSGAGESRAASAGGQLGRSDEDVLIAAADRYIVSFDNLSTVSVRQSDVLCGLITGTSAEKRKRYSDDESSVVPVMRAVSLTSRTLPMGVGTDLLDRLIVLDQERMAGKLRAEKSKLWQRFHDTHPATFGAVLNLAVAALAHRERADRVTELPRMADHGRVLAALDAATGAGYLATYVEATNAAKAVRAETDPLVSALLDLVTSDEQRGQWEGTASDLLDSLLRPLDVTSWPRSGRVLRQHLNAASELLRAAGITIRDARTGKARRMVIEYAEPGG